jgi:hypothetical protein
MKRFIILLFTGLYTVIFSPAKAQENKGIETIEIRGKVVDAQSGEPLPLATLTLQDKNISTITNSEGIFVLKIPSQYANGKIQISYLGYQTKILEVSGFAKGNTVIKMEEAITPLNEVSVTVPRNPESLIREVLQRKGENYLDQTVKMTAFYREIIRKRKRNAALTEAVVSIYKSPYTTTKPDLAELFKARKSTDYSKLDTLTLKLQGGPFNALYQDLMKYQDYLFSDASIEDYTFKYEKETRIDNIPITVIAFEQKPEITEPLYYGKLFIDSNRKVLVSAVFSLNLDDPQQASLLFVKRKPARANVIPIGVNYRVDYREKEGKWFYGYSNAILEFKVNWDKRLFNSIYSLTCEMAITDWKYINETEIPKAKNMIKSSVILNDEVSGFADPDFWGAQNIIEPDKSIESAIRKIQRQIKITED